MKGWKMHTNKEIGSCFGKKYERLWESKDKESLYRMLNRHIAFMTDEANIRVCREHFKNLHNSRREETDSECE